MKKHITIAMVFAALCAVVAGFLYWSEADAGPNSPCYWGGTYVRCLPSNGILVGKYGLLENSGAGTDIISIVAPSVAAAITITTPSVTGTLATLAGSESLTNKKLGSLTTNGPIYTSGGDGTLNSEATLAVSRGGLNQSAALVAGGLIYGASTTAAASGTAGSAASQWALSGTSGTGAPSFSDTTLRAKTISSETASGANPALTIKTYQNSGTSDPRTEFFAGDGTAASTTAIVSGDFLHTLEFFGYYDATHTAGSASIAVQATANWTGTTAAGSKMVFTTSPNSGTAEQTRMTIQAEGGVTIAETAGTATSGGNVVHQCAIRNGGATNASGTVTVCNPGEITMGGGCSPTGSVNMQESYPTGTTTNRDWHCSWASSNAWTAYVMCCVY